MIYKGIFSAGSRLAICKGMFSAASLMLLRTLFLLVSNNSSFLLELLNDSCSSMLTIFSCSMRSSVLWICISSSEWEKLSSEDSEVPCWYRSTSLALNHCWMVEAALFRILDSSYGPKDAFLKICIGVIESFSKESCLFTGKSIVELCYLTLFLLYY